MSHDTNTAYVRPAPPRRRATTTADERFAREFDELIRRDNGWTPRHRGVPDVARDQADAGVLRGLTNLAALLKRPAFDDGGLR